MPITLTCELFCLIKTIIGNHHNLMSAAESRIEAEKIEKNTVVK